MQGPIVHLCASPTPYRNAEWDEAVKTLGPDKLALVFIEDFYDTACWQPCYPALCPFYCIDSGPDENRVPFDQFEALLERFDPRMVIVSGYLARGYQVAMRWCRARGVPFCLRSASNIYADYHKGWLRYVVRRYRLGGWVRWADQCLVTGTYNRRFWQRYGMKPSQEGWFPQWIDYGLFRQGRELRARRDELRQQFGIKPELALFTAGRILPLKKIDLLCEALLRLDDRVGLVVAGHGVHEPYLRETYASRLGERLMFVGDVEPRDLPQWYAATDVYALASGERDMWGHVITESATSGMPILIHYKTGAAGDLVHNERNGFVLRSFDPADWAAALQRFLDQPELLQEMGAESARIADDWQARSNPAECLSRLMERYAS